MKSVPTKPAFRSGTRPALVLAALAAAAVFAQAVDALAEANRPGQPSPPASKPAAGDPEVAKFLVPQDKEPNLTDRETIGLLRQHVNYVFVLYQENRSFDSYFGTFPGADGIFSKPPEETPGFYQRLTDTNGATVTIQPFRIGPKDYAADTDDVDHSHAALVAKMQVVGKVAKMDHFAQVEERKYWTSGAAPSLQAKQMGELAMAYMDGDTIPFLWRYANRFVLFDHIFQSMTGPSTPGNLSIIAAQSGQTQAALHPDQGSSDPGDRAPGVPVLNDNDPFWGSPSDRTPAGSTTAPAASATWFPPAGRWPTPPGSATARRSCSSRVAPGSTARPPRPPPTPAFCSAGWT